MPAATTAASGTYTVTVKDANNCTTVTNSVTITQPSAITASAAAGVILCNGGTTTLTVTASGGTGTLQYSKNGGTTYQAANTFTVTAGTYTITVKDANNCTVATSSLTITQPVALSATASPGTIFCNGGTTILTATASGGTSPYLYSINGGTTYQAANSFTVSAGSYTITVKDANICTAATSSVTVTQPAVISASAAAGTVLCNGGTSTFAMRNYI